MKKRMTYVLGKAPFDDATGDYLPRPVNKQIKIIDGANEYVQMEKTVAHSLEEFRKAFPHEPVTGAPTTDEARLVLDGMSDEELAAIGVQRVPADAAPQDGRVYDEGKVAFADLETALLAQGKGISEEDLVPAGGSGFDGAYTTDDIRALVE